MLKHSAKPWMCHDWMMVQWSSWMCHDWMMVQWSSWMCHDWMMVQWSWFKCAQKWEWVCAREWDKGLDVLGNGTGVVRCAQEWDKGLGVLGNGTGVVRCAQEWEHSLCSSLQRGTITGQTGRTRRKRTGRRTTDGCRPGHQRAFRATARLNQINPRRLLISHRLLI